MADKAIEIAQWTSKNDPLGKICIFFTFVISTNTFLTILSQNISQKMSSAAISDLPKITGQLPWKARSQSRSRSRCGLLRILWTQQGLSRAQNRFELRDVTWRRAQNPMRRKKNIFWDLYHLFIFSLRFIIYKCFFIIQNMALAKSKATHQPICDQLLEIGRRPTLQQLPLCKTLSVPLCHSRVADVHHAIFLPFVKNANELLLRHQRCEDLWGANECLTTFPCLITSSYHSTFL